MEDFNSFASSGGNQKETDIFNMVKNIAGKYDGKSTNDILSAIYREAKKGKKEGTLSNEQIDNFAKMLSPLLDDKQRSYLRKIVEELKRI